MSDDATLDEFTETNSGGGAAKKEVTKPTSWGKIPPDWDENTISEITQLVTDGSHNPPKRVEDGIQILSGRNIQNGYIDFNKEPSYISQSDFEQMDNNHSLRQGDLLMTIVGSIGRSAIVNKKTDFALQRSIALLRTNERVTTPFLKYITDSGRFHKQADSRSRATAQGGLYLEALNKINLPVPPLSEQRKIATVLHTVDQAIQKTEQCIERLNRVLRGMRQNMFTVDDSPTRREVRIGPKSFCLPDNWSINTLSKLTNDITEIDHHMPDKTDEGVPFLAAGDISDTKKLDLEQTEKVSKEDWERLSDKFDPKMGDIVYTRFGTIGIAKRVNTKQKFLASYSVALLKPIESIYTPFFEHAMNSPLLRNQAERRTRGSANKNLNLGQIKKMRLPFLPLSKQKDIADRLDSVIDKIQFKGRYLNQLQSFKQGLMQDLLSGKVRTTDVDIDIPEEVAKYG